MHVIACSQRNLRSTVRFTSRIAPFLLNEQARVFDAFREAYDRRPRLERRFAWEGSFVFPRLFRRMTGGVCADKVGGSAGDEVDVRLEHRPPTLAAHQLIGALLRGACAETALV